MNIVRSTLIAMTLLATGTFARAQSCTFEVDPHQSHVTFTLGDVLHTVHGTFDVKGGSVEFDASGGAARGSIVVDATSGNSGSKARDRRMHEKILESDKYPEISFAPRQLRGRVAPDGNSDVSLEGIFTIHGQPHDLSVSVPVEAHGGALTADIKFVVPYVQWGMKNPSTLFLRVSDKVEIDVHAVGQVHASSADAACAAITPGAASARR